MTTTPPEALCEMGAEFHHAAAMCKDALWALEDARQLRLTFLRDAIKRNEERLADIKEEVRRLPEQIAKWEAERARLESQTGLDLLRAVVAEPRAEVEKMPDEAEKRLPVATPQPKGGRAVVTFGGLPYYADSVKFDDAGKLVKGEGVPFGLPPSPALLDLRTLKVGTVCEATAGAIYPTKGWRYRIADQQEDTVTVDTREWGGRGQTIVPALQPARVVEEPKGESDG